MTLLTDLVLVFLFIIILVIWFWKNSDYLRKAEDKYQGGKYVAVVLTNKSLDDEYAIYSSGIMFLIKHLEKSKQPYKLMKKFDFDKFKKFVYDTNCCGLYIIGHGTRHSLKIGKGKKEEEVLEYSLFKGFNGHPKDFVVQLHCNHGGGESLADIIAPNTPRSFVSDSYRNAIDNLFYFICLDQPPMQMTIFLASVILTLTIAASIIKILLGFWMFLCHLPKRLLGIEEANNEKSK